MSLSSSTVQFRSSATSNMSAYIATVKLMGMTIIGMRLAAEKKQVIINGLYRNERLNLLGSR
ncbi:MAG: hypothetical protein ACRC6N_11055 [Plesiomonas sp.]|uniref:hypothetical protein n=1 Tax=Plesiomonas sp. TaxID=2486279 RepID=UPI003F31D8EA